uniref:Uncharacterized protein n=1 Tax=Odontella aurita TaxID=265563 RepID=A0A7S4J384_9STRA|mmetsp:Transcript_37112/g.111180  ORF Transcript_37112/g.111180 Transcript_37112/m.111180 type:complete len:131 (+) Transcript_37112:261-653(+)
MSFSERLRHFFSKRMYSPSWLGFFSAALLLCGRPEAPSNLVSARVADERLTRFLYADFPGNAEGAVSEYQIHTTKSGDYERDAGDVDDDGLGRRRRPAGSEYEEQQHVRPYFLTQDVDNPRIVQVKCCYR